MPAQVCMSTATHAQKCKATHAYSMCVQEQLAMPTTVCTSRATHACIYVSRHGICEQVPQGVYLFLWGQQALQVQLFAQDPSAHCQTRCCLPQCPFHSLQAPRDHPDPAQNRNPHCNWEQSAQRGHSLRIGPASGTCKQECKQEGPCSSGRILCFLPLSQTRCMV